MNTSIVKSESGLKAYNKIIFFDGVCNVCNGFVDFVLKNNPSQDLYFSSLQSNFASKFLEERNLDASDLNTIYFFENGKMTKKSEAVLSIAKYLSKPISFVQFLMFVPENILNMGYDFVAKNRYTIMGKKDTCRMVTKEERSRFLE